MARITVQVPDEERDALKQWAKEEGVSVPELVRRAVKRTLEERAKPSRRELMERALSIVGKYHSGKSDIAERHDDYLAEGPDE